MNCLSELGSFVWKSLDFLGTFHLLSEGGMGRNVRKLEFFHRPPPFLLEYFVDPLPTVKNSSFSLFPDYPFGNLNISCS